MNKFIPVTNLFRLSMHALMLVLILAFLTGCGVYSFTDGRIPSEVKNISILNFPNDAANGPPNLSQLFTEKLRSYYQQNSNLVLVKSNGDWQLEGRIIGYDVTNTGIQSNEIAGINRLVIKIEVKFINTLDEKASFTNVFTSPPTSGDFPANQSLSQVEGTLVNKMLDQMVLDIFTKTSSNW
ncbi:MAG: LPS assembly lipoprotein LptE [Sporocytophaga sp.]|nr:LPS assembly lipoprotein LptE [Sporocytophaga sp.]